MEQAPVRGSERDKHLENLLAQLSMQPHEIEQQFTQPQIPVSPFAGGPIPPALANLRPQQRQPRPKEKKKGRSPKPRGGGGRGRGLRLPEGMEMETDNAQLSQQNQPHRNHNHNERKHPQRGYNQRSYQQSPQQPQHPPYQQPSQKMRKPGLNAKFAFANLARRRTGESAQQDLVCIIVNFALSH